VNHNLPRRDFLQQSATLLSALALAKAGAASATPVPAPAKLPLRRLGRTGIDVSALIFGAGKFFQELPDGQWEPLVQRALDLGINYFDEASGYHFDKRNAHSETRMGQILPAHRKSVYVCTKLDQRDPELAKRELDGCLQRLRMDYVDVLMVHSITQKETDLGALEKGIYAQLRKWKAQGVARHIGFSTMMTDGPMTGKLIEVLDPDVTLMAISAAKHGSIAENALPAAKARNTGFIAMKMLRDVVGKGPVSARDLLHYAWALPGVAALCVGHSSLSQLEENAKTVRELARGLAALDRGALERKLAHLATPETLSWIRPDYADRGTGLGAV
jgi:aryl-alcohol dehydrogenase-like predicted oxidoreductase